MERTPHEWPEASRAEIAVGILGVVLLFLFLSWLDFGGAL